MKPVKPIELTLRILLAWLAAALVGICFGQAILTALEPLFRAIILFVQKDFSPVLDIVTQHGAPVLRLSPLTVRPYQLTSSLHLRAGFMLDSVSTSVDHAILPLVILLMGLFVWPVHNGIREIGLRIVSGLAGAVLVSGVTTPLFLVARVQMNTMMYAMRVGANPAHPVLIDWMIFTESGGRWLIPIVVAVICIALSHALSARN